MYLATNQFLNELDLLLKMILKDDKTSSNL